MAGEKKGKAYEAFVKLALDDLKKSGEVKGNIYWDQKPKGMTVDTDFLIGSDKDNPIANIFVSHGGSAKESNRKFWRNVGEMVESKLCVKSPPKCYSIFFDTVIKEGIKSAGSSTYDGELLVGDQAYGPNIQQWIDGNLSTFPTDKHKKVTHLDTLRKTDKILSRLHSQFKTDLKVLLTKTQLELDSLWDAEVKRTKGKAPRAKDTFVRRGLSKLLIFEDLNIALRLFKGKPVKASEIGSYAFELGLARKFATAAKPLDKEIQNTVKLLAEKTIRDILAKAPVSGMNGWIHTLQRLPHLDFMAQYVVTEYNQLTNRSILAHRLRDLHSNPKALVKGALPAGWPPKSNWLFEIILEITKRIGGDSTNYGYAQLEQDCEKISGMPKAGDVIYRTTLPGWVHRRKGSGLANNILDGISEVLANILKASSPAQIALLANKKESLKYATNIINTKLCSYRMFEPLRTCIELVEPGVIKESIRACFGERAGLGGQATKTTLVKVRNTLINWQSCTEGGRVHKKKELCGRAIALRYSWDDSKKVFIERPGVKKLILVVDGNWKQSDLDALVRSGWDEIFYPDEMDKLKAVIV